jgi:hypothetical protein
MCNWCINALKYIVVSHSLFPVLSGVLEKTHSNMSSNFYRILASIFTAKGIKLTMGTQL